MYRLAGCAGALLQATVRQVQKTERLKSCSSQVSEVHEASGGRVLCYVANLPAIISSLWTADAAVQHQHSSLMLLC